MCSWLWDQCSGSVYKVQHWKNITHSFASRSFIANSNGIKWSDKRGLWGNMMKCCVLAASYWIIFLRNKTKWLTNMFLQTQCWTWISRISWCLKAFESRCMRVQLFLNIYGWCSFSVVLCRRSLSLTASCTWTSWHYPALEAAVKKMDFPI